jgi:hypothetical protein
MSRGGKYFPWWAKILVVIAFIVGYPIMYALHYWPITILFISMIVAFFIKRYVDNE